MGWKPHKVEVCRGLNNSFTRLGVTNQFFRSDINVSGVTPMSHQTGLIQEIYDIQKSFTRNPVSKPPEIYSTPFQSLFEISRMWTCQYSREDWIDIYRGLQILPLSVASSHQHPQKMVLHPRKLRPKSLRVQQPGFSRREFFYKTSFL